MLFMSAPHEEGVEPELEGEMLRLIGVVEDMRSPSTTTRRSSTSGRPQVTNRHRLEQSAAQAAPSPGTRARPTRRPAPRLLLTRTWMSTVSDVLKGACHIREV